MSTTPLARPGEFGNTTPPVPAIESPSFSRWRANSARLELQPLATRAFRVGADLGLIPLASNPPLLW